MNVWLATALAFVAALLPVGVATLRRPAVEGLAALQVATVDVALVLVLLAIGTDRQPFVDLALAAALLGFAGTIVFAALLGRRG